MNVVAKICLQDNPATIKNTAKKIRMPDGSKPVFNTDRDKEIMSKALRVKFSHEPLKQELLETGTKRLVEANEHSLYMGAGVSLKSRKFVDKKKLKRKSALGDIIMSICRELYDGIIVKYPQMISILMHYMVLCHSIC